MDLSNYKVQEIFQSTTLRERKRNLRRQMEEYMGTVLRRNGRNLEDLGNVANVVADPVYTPYKQDERSRNK